MADTEEEPGFGPVLAITQTQYDTLAADPETFEAWAGLPDGVTCTGLDYLGRITNEDGDVIGYACAHPRLEPEIMAEVLEDSTLLEDVKQRRSTDRPGWAIEAREAARAKVAGKSKAARKKARDDNAARLTPKAPAKKAAAPRAT